MTPDPSQPADGPTPEFRAALDGMNKQFADILHLNWQGTPEGKARTKLAQMAEAQAAAGRPVSPQAKALIDEVQQRQEEARQAAWEHHDQQLSSGRPSMYGSDPNMISYKGQVDERPGVADYAAAIPGIPIAAYNNNMPKITGSDRSTVGNLLGGGFGRFVDGLGDSFNKVLDNAIPPSTARNSPRRAINEGIEAASLAGLVAGAPQGASAVRLAGNPDTRFPAKTMASIDRDLADNAAMQQRMESERLARRGPGLGAEVEIRKPAPRPSEPSQPATPPVKTAPEQTGATSAPQPTATSADSATATPGPQTPAPAPASSTPQSVAEPKFPPRGVVSDGQGGYIKPAPYSGQHKKVAREMIEARLRENGSLPTALEINDAFDPANLLRVDPKKMQGRLDTLRRNVVDPQVASGSARDQVADTAQVAMKRAKELGYKGLPAVVGASIAGSSDTSPSASDNAFYGAVENSSNDGEAKHHSHYQPRSKRGQFSGAPVYE